MVIWTDNSITNITEFLDEAKEGTEETAKTYMQKLVDYVDIIEIMPEIGKNINFLISDYEVRQIIYKKHRIFYVIKEENAVILAIIHTRLDIGKALKKLKRDMM